MDGSCGRCGGVRGWRQVDLAARASCSQSMVSLIERGHLDRLSLRSVKRIVGALDAAAFVEIRWRAGELDRLLDEDHARLVGAVADLLRRSGWHAIPEVTYAQFRERGSYDLLAFHAATGTALVVEVKTDLPSIEATLRKVDEKARLAPVVARDRFGWKVRAVGRLIVLPNDRTLRRQVDRHAAVLQASVPIRGVAVRRWLAAPTGAMAGLWFVSSRNPRGVSRATCSRARVRLNASVTRSDVVAA